MKKILFILFSVFFKQICPYSPLRIRSKQTPSLSVCWESLHKNKKSDTKTYTLHDSHLEVFPLFQTFNKKHFYKNILPRMLLSGRNKNDQSVSGAVLHGQIQTLLAEIKEGKTKFAHFKIIKRRDFIFKKKCGLLVVKSKKHPFVVKLFMETPETFTCPYSKGFEQGCFYIIGGGANRHVVGFTRIKNLDAIRRRINDHPYWSKYIDLPRKWFWVPENEPWLSITGKNVCGFDKIVSVIPGTYAIVADEIKGKEQLSLFNKRDRQFCIDLSNFLLCRIDPHIKNFLKEEETGKIVIIDTEHFPTLVGFKKRPKITSYTSWYLNLMVKWIRDRMMRSKKKRRAIQTNPIPPFSLA